MTEPETPLVAEFAAASREDWLRLVAEVLRGADFDARLVSRTIDGLRLEPLSTRADAAAAPAPQLGRAGRWDIRQRHAEPEPKLANAAVLEDLAGGVNSLLLQIAAPGQSGIGCGRDPLAQVLSGCELRGLSIAFDARENTLDVAGSLIAMWREAGIAEGERTAFFNLDPLGVLAKTGTLYYPLPRSCVIAAKFADACRSMPNVRVLLADGRPYHEAGGSETQELAAVLATLVAYLRAAEAEGQPPHAAMRGIALGLAADADLFLTIAKLRALRRLVARIAEVCGAADAVASLHLTVTTSERMLTRRDPWVNILRAAVACTAAALGGADAISVFPFTWALGKPDALARRIARNTQIILQQESALARVCDPAAGAFAIEAVTQTLAGAAWALFQQIEAKGGMGAALQSGFLQATIASTAAARQADIAHGRSALTGVSAFARLGTDGIDVEPHPPTAPIVKGGIEVAPLPLQRIAEPFERLRDAADAHQARTGKRPQVFLAALGDPAMYAARTTWITNFLAAGGIEALPSEALHNASDAARAVAASGASVVCLCSSDQVYAALAAETAVAVRAAGARKVLLAGRPQGELLALATAGIDEFIAAGADAPRVLTALHGALGIAS